MSGVTEELRERLHLPVRQPLAGQVQVDAEQRHPDRAERHQADLDHPARQARARERADGDAQREHAGQRVGHRRIASQRDFRKRGEMRQQQHAIEPQPGDSE